MVTRTVVPENPVGVEYRPPRELWRRLSKHSVVWADAWVSQRLTPSDPLCSSRPRPASAVRTRAGLRARGGLPGI